MKNAISVLINNERQETAVVGDLQAFKIPLQARLQRLSLFGFKIDEDELPVFTSFVRNQIGAFSVDAKPRVGSHGGLTARPQPAFFTRLDIDEIQLLTDNRTSVRDEQPLAILRPVFGPPARIRDLR